LGLMMDQRVRELVLISVLAAFCGGLAWALDLPEMRGQKKQGIQVS